MERLLERVSLSQYRDNFVLKGGLLVSSLVGVDMRSTMDVDTTVKSLPLNKRSAQKILEELIAVKTRGRSCFSYSQDTGYYGRS